MAGETRDAGAMETVARALMTIGGGLVVVVFPVVIVLFVLLGFAFAIGFAQDPGEVAGELDGFLLVTVVVLGGISVALIWTLIRAVRGARGARVVLLVTGTLLALASSPFPQRLGPDFQRPEDIRFTLMQLGVSLAPAVMALGAFLGLFGSRRPPPG